MWFQARDDPCYSLPRVFVSQLQVGVLQPASCVCVTAAGGGGPGAAGGEVGGEEQDRAGAGLARAGVGAGCGGIKGPRTLTYLLSGP